ncbi:MAG: hypothetical protein LQ343_000941 [Gyalolechia ehrenbergii]|nr:MAG: hypothetical protein LQ343_000941 [Gyalolechia ehrenbergii]
MDKVKGVAKEGWHPKERSLKQMIRREKDPQSQAQDHISRPLATLKDPNAFGPPPKNVNYHGGAAVPNAITPDRRGLGAPLSTQEIRAKEEAERREARAADEAARKPASPPIPYRADTSGLTTRNLPKPPVRRLEYDDQSSASSVRPNPKPKPSLPPRLPPRQGSILTVKSPSPPPPYSATSEATPARNGQIDQGAVGRLAAAGVSVPGFGIESNPQAARGTVAATTSPTSIQGSNTDNAQLSELQSRFSRLSTKSQNPEPPSRGTSLAEKQAAVNTAQALRDDPSSVSLSDARNTAATANNFRERHGDQVSAGWKSANAFNKKHDVANRLNSYASQEGPSSKTGTSQSPPNPTTISSASFPLHKRAPPPPPQKPSFSGGSITSPPPVPISSKPKT